jgi:hypothetical protein
MAKAACNNKIVCTNKSDLNLRKTPVKCYFFIIALYGPANEHFENSIRNTWKVLKCGSGGGWRKRVWTN